VALLDKIREPADLRRLPRTMLASAAAALREELIARGGGAAVTSRQPAPSTHRCVALRLHRRPTA
jgi:hypothetical protein